jgi:uncharacterized protein
MQRAFLHAHWSNVGIVSYAVSSDLLKPLLPRGCELDFHKGQAWVSLVAFDFDEIKVRGWSIPFHTSFPEVNLRFYVRQGKDRGVCFIREFVPKRLVAWVAGRVYHEPYQAVAMTSDVHRLPDGIQVEHKLKAAGHTQKITIATTKDPPLLASAESDEAWFKEHEWGFGRDGSGHTLKYRIAHPQWLTYKVAWHEVKIAEGSQALERHPGGGKSRDGLSILALGVTA